MPKHLPIICLFIMAGTLGGLGAPAAAVADGVSVTGGPWKDSVKDRLRDLHRHVNTTSSLPESVTVEEAMRIVMADYFAWGFDPEMTEEEEAKVRTEIDELYCLLQNAPPAEVDPAVLVEFMAAAVVMYVDVGGQVVDLGC